MNRIQTILETLFNDDRRWPHDGRRIIFWYDADGQFQETFDELAIEGIEKLLLNRNPFHAKYRLLVQSPNENFLVYAPYGEPPSEDNWLLDIQLYSLLFRADRAALLHDDLGFQKRHLENIIRQHLQFFESKKRTETLLKMELPADTDESGLFLALLSVLAGLKVADANLFLRQVLMKGTLESDNTLWQEIERFDLVGAFWRVARERTDFESKTPSLNKLLKCLLVTHFQKSLHGELPTALRTHAIAPGQRAYAFVDSWMRDSLDLEALQKLSGMVSEELNLESVLPTLDPEIIHESATFELVDQSLLRRCVKAIERQEELTPWPERLQARKTLIWFEKYRHHYAALEAAIALFSLKAEYPNGFRGTATELFTAYAGRISRFDRAYREFIVAADRARGDILKPLVETVENLYTRWYLEELGQAWSDALGDRWELEDIPSQTVFYRRNVQPLLDKSDREKVFVLISDALRYEVADALKTRIQQELRGDIHLTPYLGVLPSVTKTGMAALLPGNRLTLKPGSDDALRDDSSTRGSEARESVLAGNGGVPAKVILAKNLLAMNTELGRATVQPYRLLYIYHNLIDATGDNPASEDGVLEACERAIEEISRSVKKICNSLNGTRVFITSDHGFLYQRHPLTDAEKRPLPERVERLESGRRYFLSGSPVDAEGTKAFTLPYDPRFIAVVPRGSLRFAVAGGGSRFVHGGASLQEICVPVIAYHHKRADRSEEELARKVSVEVNTSVRRVTNNRFNLSLVQSEPVEGRWRARRISIALYDPRDNGPITDIPGVELSATSPKPSERTVSVRLTITSPHPPSSAYLIIKDTDDESELVRESWTISLGIVNDFGDF
jgi:uncharacterized protein (TIGR02687 family)